eukprot:189086-Hanusia_phi.AAC.2
MDMDIANTVLVSTREIEVHAPCVAILIFALSSRDRLDTVLFSLGSNPFRRASVQCYRFLTPYLLFGSKHGPWRGWRDVRHDIELLRLQPSVVPTSAWDGGPSLVLAQ